jgi:hypothetical protein
MQRPPLYLLLPLFALAACATSGQQDQSKAKAKIPEPGIGLEQVVGPAELGYPYGPMEIKYNFAVQNNASIPLTLVRIDLHTDDPPGGAYSLRRNFYNFKQEIPPNSVGVVTFWAKAVGWGRSMRDTEPVTVRGVAYFETPAGNTQKVFIRELSQYAQ